MFPALLEREGGRDPDAPDVCSGGIVIESLARFGRCEKDEGACEEVFEFEFDAR